MRKTAPVCESQDDYRRMLVEKRREVAAGLGVKFDTMARMGRVAEAVAQFEEVLRLNPDHAGARAALARLQAAR